MAYQLLKNLDELRIGLFVKLECSWWSHPFATSRFKIISAKDIEAIRNIRKLKLYYDPQLSDSASKQPPVDEYAFIVDHQDQPGSEEIHEDDEGEFPLDLEQEVDVEPDYPATQEPERPSELSEFDSDEIRKNRKRIYQERRANLKKVEDAYWKVLGKAKDIFKRVGAGHLTAVKSSIQIVSNINEVLQRDQATMTLMDVVSSTGMTEGLSSHALNVCILSTIVGREMGLSNEDIHILGMAALFHDMGKRLLPMKVKFHASGITMQADAESNRLHPEKCRDLLIKYKEFPRQSGEIIFQHHERLDGSGFPQGLRNDEISLSAQILMVADEYDELCNSSDPEKSLTPHEALAQLYRSIDIERPKYSREVILAFIRTLTVFPPGTLVELSDGTFGLVISVNMRFPTQPLLLSSHYEGLRQEALMIDLAQETHLQITKSLRPKDLPPKVLEFLSPRRTSLFIHPDKSFSPLASAQG